MSAHSEFNRSHKGRLHRSPAKRRHSHLADTDLAAAASDAIKILTTVPQESIKVTAHDGWLHLEGKVNWRHQRAIVEDVTRHLPGVRGLTDSIVIEAALQ